MFNRFKYLVFILFLPFMMNGQQYTATLNAPVSNQDFEMLKSMIVSGTYQFEAKWATSGTGNHYNLISNPSFLNVDRLHLQSFLPYYGSLHSADFKGNGLKFNGAIEHLEVNYNDSRKKALISFKVLNGSEHFQYDLTVFSNRKATLHVSSSKRSTIKYTGKLKKLNPTF